MNLFRALYFSAFFVILSACAGFSAEPSFHNSYVTDGPAQAYKIENSFSTTAGGIDSVLSNPAGIARSSTFEFSVGYAPKLNAKSSVTFTASDEQFEGFDSSGGGDFFYSGLYLTDDPTDAPTNEFKTRDIKVSFDYETGAGVTDFGVAYNFADVFAFGISRKRASSFDIELGAYGPAIFRNTMDLKGKTFSEGFTIEADGTASFYSSGNTLTTEAPLYDRFTYNSSFAAISSDILLDDQVIDSREIVLTFGGKSGDFMWGFNAIPISSSISMNNAFVTKTTSSAADMVYYVPAFDPDNPLSVIDWFDETNQIYSREAGYTTYTIKMSPEAYVYNGIASGEYSASAMRLDFGLIYQPFKDMSISLVYENIGGANLEYRGINVASTWESYVDNQDPPEFELGTNATWEPFQPNPVSIDDGFILPEEFTVYLPRKGKIGIAITKPFLIAIDYERYFSEIYLENMTIQDLGYLKVGLESSLFGLPIIGRFESKWLVKPTILVEDQAQADDINKMLESMPVIPTSFTFGLGMGLFGNELGADFTENHASLLSIYEGQLLDFMKVLSYDIYLRNDTWDITYTAIGEPFYMLSENAELLQSGDEGSEISAADVKTNWIYSIKFGYRF